MRVTLALTVRLIFEVRPESMRGHVIVGVMTISTDALHPNFPQI
jgi:hypothetical protein